MISNLLCSICGHLCEAEAGLAKHRARHQFMAQLAAGIRSCWFCSGMMWEVTSMDRWGDKGMLWSVEERIRHIQECYTSYLAGVDTLSRAMELRSEMVMAR